MFNSLRSFFRREKKKNPQTTFESKYKSEQVYMVDLFTTPKEDVLELQKKGGVVFAEVPSQWEDTQPDSDFLKKSKIQPVTGWTKKAGIVLNKPTIEIMTKRADMAVDKGFDGIKVRGLMPYTKTALRELRYLHWWMKQANKRNLLFMLDLNE